MAKRPYVSPQRAAATAETRRRILLAAKQILREEDIAAFSLDAVGKAAGVTRLTVYNQFGSRAGLLEAVFDEIALGGRLPRLRDAIGNPDAREGLAQLIDIFCDFWSSDPAVERLHGAMAADEELADALRARNERRRAGIRTLIERIEGPRATKAERDVIDLIFGLTSCAMYHMLAQARTSEAVAELIKQASNDAIARLVAPASRRSDLTLGHR